MVVNQGFYNKILGHSFLLINLFVVNQKFDGETSEK